MFNSKGLTIAFIFLTFALISAVDRLALASSEVNRMGNFYTVVSKKGTSFVADPVSKSLVFHRPEGRLISKVKDQFVLHTFERETADYLHTLVVKEDRRTGNKSWLYLRAQSLERFLKCEEHKSSLSRIENDIKKFKEIIDGGSQASKVVLGESCRSLHPIDKKILQSAVLQFTGRKESYFAKCVEESEHLKIEMERNPALASRLAAATAQLASDSHGISNGNMPFKIECERTSKYKGKYKNGTFTFATQEGNGTERLNITDRCNDIETTLLHEYVHRSGVNEEAGAVEIGSLCAKKLRPLFFKNSECASVYPGAGADSSSDKPSPPINLNNDDQKNATTIASGRVVSSRQITAEQIQEAPAITAQMANTQTRPITVTDADWSNLASNDVRSPAAIGSASRLAKDMQGNYSALSTKLDALAAIATDKAIAAMANPGNQPSGSNSGSAAAGTPRTYAFSGKRSSSGDDQFYTVEEYLVDQNAPPAGSSTTGLAANSSPSTATAANPTRAPASAASATSASSALESAGSSATSASLPAGAGTGVNTASTGGTQFGQATAPAPAAKPGTSPSRGVASVGNASSIPVQTFKTRAQIDGEQYQSIRSSYRNRAFASELAEQGISITVQDSGMTIGAKKDRASLQFIDDGSRLKRVDGK